jgi:hypothetical protein
VLLSTQGFENKRRTRITLPIIDVEETVLFPKRLVLIFSTEKIDATAYEEEIDGCFSQPPSPSSGALRSPK